MTGSTMAHGHCLVKFNKGTVADFFVHDLLLDFLGVYYLILWVVTPPDLRLFI